nr:hypothetical protein [Tanacetum cinerariifolium]GEW08940.1 hypothetical protein [Tanacetum cinerariifolium]
MARDDNNGDHPETSNTSPPVPSPTQQIPHTISSIKLPILKREYDIWAMKMEHYLSHTDYLICQVIHNGNGHVYVTTDTNRIIKVLPPKTVEEVMVDAKEMWEAIKSRFGRNKESKKMQKYLLKQQFKGFFVSTSEGMHKGYDRSQVALIMRAKPGLDTLSFDDLYNNLTVFEQSQKEGSSSHIDEVIHSFFANQLSAPQLDYDDLEHINDDDMEEIDLKWQVAMISMRIKKFHKRTGRKLQFDTKDLVSFDKTKVKCFNCYKMGHFSKDCRAKGNQDIRRRNVGYNGNKTRDNGRRLAYHDDSKSLVTIDGEDIDWSGHVKFMKTDLDDKTDVLAYHKKLLAEALKEKEDLKNKFENWQNSYKNLSKWLNTKISINDKFAPGYGDYRYGSIMRYENEVLQSMFMNKASDLEDTPVNNRIFNGMHEVLLLMTRNYIPSGPDVETDYSKFTYGPKQTSSDESDSKPIKYASCDSDSSVETSTSMPALVQNASKVVCEPKVWIDASIIEEYESDSDNDSVSNVQEDKENPSFAFTDSIKHGKTSRENIKETGTTNNSPKIKKYDRNGHTRKGLGYAFTKKACVVCGSFSHLIRDWDFHEKIMSNQAELTKSKNKDDSYRALKDKGIVDSRCSRHMTRNKAYLSYYQEFKGGSVSFGGSNGRITGKGKIKTGIGLPSKIFENDHTYVSCQKGKQHKASCKAKKDETTPILKDFISQAENQFTHKVKTIRSENETEFKNKELIEFYGLKGIKREYSNARTPQQNRVAERKNMNLIEAARTMLADSFLPTKF